MLISKLRYGCNSSTPVGPHGRYDIYTVVNKSINIIDTPAILPTSVGLTPIIKKIIICFNLKYPGIPRIPREVDGGSDTVGSNFMNCSSVLL